MTKEEKKAFKKGKIDKKIEAKTEILSEDIYEDKVFACYAEKVAAAQKVLYSLLCLSIIFLFILLGASYGRQSRNQKTSSC